MPCIADPDVLFKYTNCTNKKLSHQQKVILDSPLGYEELSKALMQMLNGKTPGSSGLTTDFYKVFWSRFGRIYYKALMQSIQQGELYCIV